MGNRLTFDVAFLSALSNSVVLVYPSTIVGGEAMSGASYQCNDAIIKKNVTLPGGDVSYVRNENCRVFGLAPDKVLVDDRLSLIYSDLKAIRTEIDDKFNPELKAIRTQIDELDRVFRNFIIAVLAVLTIAAIGSSAFYVWQRHRRREVMPQRGKFSGL